MDEEPAASGWLGHTKARVLLLLVLVGWVAVVAVLAVSSQPEPGPGALAAAVADAHRMAVDDLGLDALDPVTKHNVQCGRGFAGDYADSMTVYDFEVPTASAAEAADTVGVLAAGWAAQGYDLDWEEGRDAVVVATPDGVTLRASVGGWDGKHTVVATAGPCG